MSMQKDQARSSEIQEKDTIKDSLKTELDQAKRELKEIELMIEQSHVEVNKLAQRNASITAHLQQVLTQFDNIPRADIRMAYESALETQQRLFVMRGQLDKLQSDQTHIVRYQNILEQALDAVDAGNVTKDGRQKGSGGNLPNIEMLIDAQEAERQRLARQMHDGPAQALANFILQTEIAVRLFDMDQAKAREELINLKASATSAFQKVRDFIFELRPMMLDDLGLSPTLSRYMEAFKEQTGSEVRLNVSGLEQRLESYIEVMIFRAIQELINNSITHGQASQVRVQVDASELEVRISVEDNGKGFDTGILGKGGGLGLKLIKDRVDMLGGKIDIHSAIGKGTHITFQVPARKTAVFA